MSGIIEKLNLLGDDLVAVVTYSEAGQEHVSLSDRAAVRAKVELPVDSGRHGYGYLEPRLRFGERLTLFGVPLTKEWGQRCEGTRYMELDRYGETYVEAFAELKKYVETEMNRLVEALSEREDARVRALRCSPFPKRKASYCVTLNKSVMGMMPTLERARHEAIRLACERPGEPIEVTIVGDDGDKTEDGNSPGIWWTCTVEGTELAFTRGRLL